MRISTATSIPGKARPPRRFGQASSEATGSRWTSPNTNKYCPRSEPHALLDGPCGRFLRSFLSQRGGVRKLVLPSQNLGGRMRFRVKMCVPLLTIALLAGLAGVAGRGQDQQHVVSLPDLNKDAARPRQAPQANEEAVRTP